MKPVSTFMNRTADQSRNMPTRRDEMPIESDPVWDLLAQSPPPKAGPMFARNAVRAARLEAGAAAGGVLARLRGAVRHHRALNFSALAAAATLAVFLAWPRDGEIPPSFGDATAQTPENPVVSPVESGPESAEAFAELEEVASGELLAEADLSKFSDDELIALLGF